MCIVNTRDLIYARNRFLSYLNIFTRYDFSVYPSPKSSVWSAMQWRSSINSVDDCLSKGSLDEYSLLTWLRNFGSILTSREGGLCDNNDNETANLIIKNAMSKVEQNK